ARHRGSWLRLWNAFLASAGRQLGRAAVGRLSARLLGFSRIAPGGGGPCRTSHGRSRPTDPYLQYPAPPPATTAHRSALSRALSQGRAPGPAFLRGGGSPLPGETQSRPQRSALRNSSRSCSYGEHRNLPPLPLYQRILDNH